MKENVSGRFFSEHSVYTLYIVFQKKEAKLSAINFSNLNSFLKLFH